MTVQILAIPRIVACPRQTSGFTTRRQGVRFGRPAVLQVRAEWPRGWTALSPSTRGEFAFLLQFPFHLETPPANAAYELVTMSVEFAHTEINALGIMALDIRAVETAERLLAADVDLDVRGIGCNRIAWDLRPAAAAGLRPRSHVVQVLVDIPPGVSEISGFLRARATINHRWMRTFNRPSVIPIGPVPFTLDTPQGLGSDRTEKLHTYSGPAKVEICRRLQSDWRDLADYFDIPAFETAGFIAGREPFHVWDWLVNRGRLGELSSALRAIKRGDLTELLEDAALVRRMRILMPPQQ